MNQFMYDREISPEGLEFQPGTRQALSLVKISTPQVRFPYPRWTLIMDCYSLITKEIDKSSGNGRHEINSFPISSIGR